MLPEVKTILYATDLSKNSAFAYRYALSCAEKYGAMITIIHIIEDIGPWARSMLEAYLPEGHKEEVIKKSIQRIQKHTRGRAQAL